MNITRHDILFFGFFLSLLILAGDATAKIYINEIMASNVTTRQDEAGDYDDWIELYNGGTNPVDVSGWSLSDEMSRPSHWTFPSTTIIQPGGFLLIWCDDETDEGKLHANFNLSADGEWIGLMKPDLSVQDSVAFGKLLFDYSYGRIPDGGDVFLAINLPTPGFANPTDVLGIAEPPNISPGSGIYTSAQNITLTSRYPDALILYTIDGSVPNVAHVGKNSYEYKSAIVLDSTAVLRARLYTKNYLPSEITTAAYFLNTGHDMPIMSLVTDPANLFDEQTGIYTNWQESGREWERDVFVSFFNEKTLQFQIPSGLRIQGNSSRDREKKSFRLYFRDGYGATELEYPLFTLTNIGSFNNLVLRAGYDDDLQKSTGTLLRDPLGSELYRRLGYPISHSRLGLLYLNEDYWGIYDFRESVNEYFVQDYYGYLDVDIIRLRFGSWELDYGEAIEWNNFLNFIRDNSFESDDMYAQLAHRLDVENFTTMLVHAQATQYRSWTYGSYFIRERNPEAKWQITVWDMDRALTDIDWNGFYYYENNSGEYWINIITKRLMENAGYRRYFINRLCDLFNSTFLPENVTPVLDSLAAYVEPEIPQETARWKSSTDMWFQNINMLHEFVTDRPAIVREQMQDYFNLEAPVTIHLDANANLGKIQLNTIVLADFPWHGLYYSENKISVTALPQPGFQFAGWSDGVLPQKSTFEIYPFDGLTLSALFKPLDDHLVINEIMYAQTDEWNCRDWIEIYNPDDATVNLGGWRLTDGDQNTIFTFEPNTAVTAGEYLVVCENAIDFKSCYPHAANIVGDTHFSWDGQDNIRLLDRDSALVDDVTYDSQPPWDERPASGQFSLALLNPQLDNTLAENWQAEDGYGSPGQKNFLSSDIRMDSKNAPISNFELQQNYPNPFNNSTRIIFQLPKDEHVLLKVYDLRGRLTATLIDKQLAAGMYTIDWQPHDLSSGLYFYQMTAGDFKQTNRLVLQK